MNKTLPFIFMTLLVLFTVSSGYADDLDLANLFKGKGINGTIVISSLDGSKTYTHNNERANTSMVPASTFKIPNTLIALEEGAVADENEVRYLRQSRRPENVDRSKRL